MTAEKKTWDARKEEKMWACGTANLPNNGDTIIDCDGDSWRVRVNGGYSLIGADGVQHPMMCNSVSWSDLSYWYNQGGR